MNKLKKFFGESHISKITNSRFYLTSENGDLAFEHILDPTSSLSHCRPIQNFRLIWLDSNIDEITNNDSRNTISQLRQVVNTIEIFTDINQCVNFISDIQNENIFIISSGRIGQIMVPVVHEMIQITQIYIFCQDKILHEQWTQQWNKINGVFTDIKTICKELKKDAQHSDQNSISISFIKTNVDQLDKSFMYTQILKEILLTIDFDQTHINDFLNHCRKELLVGNTDQLKNVDKIQQEYRDYKPIWWYTYDSFLYSMINRALRTMEVDLIIQLGFFIRDLHQHIDELHSEQYGGNHQSESFIVYRGQCLSQREFQQLTKTQGELLSFNNFLSTSKNVQISLDYAQQTTQTSELMGILFIIEVNPSISSTPFANVDNVSAYQKEEEILFSMHSLFRIGQIKQIDINNNRLWQVDLTLTRDNDPQLYDLTQYIRKETFPHLQGWYRLGNLLIKLGFFDKAQQVFEIMIDETSHQVEKANIYHSLGSVKHKQGKYQEAIQFYEESIKIKQKSLSPIHLDLAISYNNIGLVYESMSDDSKALSYYEKSLEIYKISLDSNHPDLATCYNNIGGVVETMGDYSKALSFYEKALEIYQETLPPYHPNLATSFNNIGLVYNKMNEYLKSLSFYEKTLEIYQKTLLPNHPDFAAFYNNIGYLYDNMGEYEKALSSHEKALQIRTNIFSSTHPDLACSYGHIGMVSYKMGDQSKAIACCKQALNIVKHSLPQNHSRIQLYKNTLKYVTN